METHTPPQCVMMIDIPCNSERFFPRARKTDALQHVWSGVNGSQGSPRLPQLDELGERTASYR